MSNGAGKPIVAMDIDGTLGDYQKNFLEFARRYFDYPGNQWMTENPGLPMWEWMGIPHREYRDAKLAYRQGGWKRWMPVYAGASSLTREIRSAGAEVWLCTTRPYLRLDNVDPDTREWLRRNGIQYDHLLFDPTHEEDGSKYHELVRQVDERRIIAIVDDLPEMVVNVNSLNLFRRDTLPLYPILMDQPYNRHITNQGIMRHRRVYDLEGVRQIVMHNLEGVWSD